MIPIHIWVTIENLFYCLKNKNSLCLLLEWILKVISIRNIFSYLLVTFRKFVCVVLQQKSVYSRNVLKWQIKETRRKNDRRGKTNTKRVSEQDTSDCGTMLKWEISATTGQEKISRATRTNHRAIFAHNKVFDNFHLIVSLIEISDFVGCFNRKRMMALSDNECFYFLLDGKSIKRMSMTLGELYEKRKKENDFLYLSYASKGCKKKIFFSIPNFFGF